MIGNPIGYAVGAASVLDKTLVALGITCETEVGTPELVSIHVHYLTALGLVAEPFVGETQITIRSLYDVSSPSSGMVIQPDLATPATLVLSISGSPVSIVELDSAPPAVLHAA